MKTFHVHSRKERRKFMQLNGGRVKRLSGTVGGPKADKTQNLYLDPLDLGRGKEHRVPLVNRGEEQTPTMGKGEEETAPHDQKPSVLIIFASIDEVVAYLTRADGTVETVEFE